MKSPSLVIKRLVVMKKGKRVYDEEFHTGFNVIRGNNGSGKSTIMDFLFFGLGGDLKDWKEHAKICDEILIEISAESKLLTLQRKIDNGTRTRPMQIFIGGFDAAIKSASDGWIYAPFSRGSENSTFTKILFEALNIPEMPGDEKNNITMHQILRLIYFDQTSPIQRIFRYEPQFDSKDTREAVSDLLCGIGGSELYAARLALRTKDKEFNKINTELNHIYKAGAAIRESLNEESLQKNINDLKEKIKLSKNRYKEIENSETNTKELAKEAEQNRLAINKRALFLKSSLTNLDEKIRGLDYEADDSRNFIKHLQMLLIEFESSALVFQSLGSAKYERCPACHDPLPDRGENTCHLCGKEQTKEEIKTKRFEVKLDLEGQISESEKLLAKRIKERDDLAKQRKKEKRELNALINKLENFTAAPPDGRSALLFETSCQIGRLEAQIEELEKLRGLSQEATKLSKEKETLQTQINKLQEKIFSYTTVQERRRRIVNAAIIKNTKYFLKLDLPQHTDFDFVSDVETFNFSFKDDWFAVNGQPNISKSASGMVVVKNSLFLGLLKTALNDGEMKYPRLLLLDNVEDKGMAPERIHNYQKIIADFCDELEEQKVDHQIIITTSNLNEDLDLPDYTIGDFYTKEHRSLRLKQEK